MISLFIFILISKEVIKANHHLTPNSIREYTKNSSNQLKILENIRPRLELYMLSWC